MASELATCIATVDVLEFVVRSVCGAHGAPEHRLFAALLIMPLALLVTLAGEAQMGAIGPESKDGAPLAPSGMTAMPEKLYVSATFAKAAEPALLAPASASAITLSPPYKRTRNFAEEGLTDRLHPFREFGGA